MKTNNIDTNIWSIHAGKTGDADTLFLEKNRIIVGWAKDGRPGVTQGATMSGINMRKRTEAVKI